MPTSPRRRPNRDLVRTYYCEFQDLERVASITPGSVQLILTDPPYSPTWLHHWGELSALASRILEPGGLLVTYTGKTYLKHVMDWLSSHLTYQWMLSSYEPGVGSVYRNRQVEGHWKPILVYSKGGWNPREVWPDVLHSPADKALHPWQQPIADAERLISYFSRVGDLVVDPCGGSFTVAEACLRTDRRCVSCDSDPSCVEIGNKRLRGE